MKNTAPFFLLIACCFVLTTSCKSEEEEEGIIDTCVDYSGRVYKTVVIGNQVWMAENLATRYFTSGASIYTPQQIADLPYQSLPVYYKYQNQESYYTIYGALYNRFCVYEPTITPTGWRIPTKEDVVTLVNHIKSSNYSFEPSDTSNWVGKALASRLYWVNNSIAGTVGNNMNTNNASGFNALPGGYYIKDDDVYFSEKYVCQFWTKSIDSTTNSLFVATLQSASKDLIFNTSEGYEIACYIRCVRDLTFYSNNH
jgi:uncharacterized protein (TIGR02145 family)